MRLINTKPGTAIRIGIMVIEQITAATKDENKIKVMVRIGLFTGLMDTEVKDKRGGRTEELVTIMTNVQADKSGKEIKKIMTSQISATGIEA